MKKMLRKYVDWAGGPSKVAEQLDLSRTTVWKWSEDGFPDTDHSGKTNYAQRLAALCRKEGHQITYAEVLKAGRP